MLPEDPILRAAVFKEAQKAQKRPPEGVWDDFRLSEAIRAVFGQPFGPEARCSYRCPVPKHGELQHSNGIWSFEQLLGSRHGHTLVMLF